MESRVELPVGIADSSLIEYRRRGPELIAHVRAWNEALIELTFRDVIAVRDMASNDFSDLVMDSPLSSEFRAYAINRAEVVSSASVHVYAFLDVEGQPTIEIVAASLEATVR